MYLETKFLSLHVAEKVFSFMPFYVYLIQSETDGTFYKGSTCLTSNFIKHASVILLFLEKVYARRTDEVDREQPASI